MTPAVLILSSLGGIVAFITGIFFIIRAITHLITATRDNTKALVEVKETLTTLGSTVDQHAITLAILEDRSKINALRNPEARGNG
jgi:hypothetical protein